jgi:hypothetical protein
MLRTNKVLTEGEIENKEMRDAILKYEDHPASAIWSCVSYSGRGRMLEVDER